MNLIVSLWLFSNALFISSAVALLNNSSVKSTTEPSGVGTLRALPSSLPFNSGITAPIALAAPVEDGIILAAPALPRLAFIPFLWATSNITWSFVYEWTVVIKPFSIPNSLFKISSTGAKQLVVHDAALITCSLPSNILWFTL